MGDLHDIRNLGINAGDDGGYSVHELPSHLKTLCNPWLPLIITRKYGANQRRGEPRNCTRAKSLCLISVWGKSGFQKQFEQMVHNHSVWKAIFQNICMQCPSVKEVFGDWTKLSYIISYLKMKYRQSIKHNLRSDLDPIYCSYFKEMDAELGKNLNQ